MSAFAEILSTVGTRGIIVFAASTIVASLGDDSPCDIGYMKIMKAYAPDCINACAQVCQPLSQAADVYFDGGNPELKLCQTSKAFKCMVSSENIQKCSTLLSLIETEMGLSVPRSGAFIDSSCLGPSVLDERPAYDENPLYDEKPAYDERPEVQDTTYRETPSESARKPDGATATEAGSENVTSMVNTTPSEVGCATDDAVRRRSGGTCQWSSCALVKYAVSARRRIGAAEMAETCQTTCAAELGCALPATTTTTTRPRPVGRPGRSRADFQSTETELSGSVHMCAQLPLAWAALGCAAAVTYAV